MSVCWSRPLTAHGGRFDEYLLQHGVKVQYATLTWIPLRRVELLREKLRLGTFDVLVSDNLLREGTDLPGILVCDYGCR